MPRLTIRIPDATMTSLRRELDSERAFRGRRYSLNDLCTRKLSVSMAAERHFDNAQLPATVAGLPRVPPPPPVPMRIPLPMPSIQEPLQPERAVRPQETCHEIQEATSERVEVGDAQVEEARALEVLPMSEEVARMLDEGAPDGNVDN